MVDPDPPETCEHCGSPLDESGLCWSCSGGGFQSGSSQVGTAPLDKSELSRVLRRGVGDRAHGSYSLSMQQAEGMAHLREEIGSMVEQFNASQQTKNSVKQSSERNAVKLLPELGPTKAAIASVAQEFLRLGRNAVEVSSCLSRVHPWVGHLSDLVVEVYPTPPGEVGVLVNGRERTFKSYTRGLYRKLRIQLFVEDGGATVLLKNAQLTRYGYDGKRVKPLSPSRFLISAGDRNFELFKLLEEAKLSGELVGNDVDQRTMLRKYSVSKLPLTERLLRESGLLHGVSAEYVRAYARKMRNGHGRSPKKLAEEALCEACERVVPACLSNLMVQKYHLRGSAMRSLVVKGELEAWRG
jgi:hypothetical protein